MACGGELHEFASAKLDELEILIQSYLEKEVDPTAGRQPDVTFIWGKSLWLPERFCGPYSSGIARGIALASMGAGCLITCYGSSKTTFCTCRKYKWHQTLNQPPKNNVKSPPLEISRGCESALGP